MTELERIEFEREGYLVFRKMLARTRSDSLRERLEELWNQEGTAAGQENYIETGARRLANLANKGGMFRALMCESRGVGRH